MILKKIKLINTIMVIFDKNRIVLSIHIIIRNHHRKNQVLISIKFHFR